MKKIALLLLICWTVTWGIAQENCPNFSDVNLPACSCDDCGFIEPKWALLNGRSSVCEGQAFQVSGAESTPLEGIEDFHWYFIELENGVFSLLDHIEKTTAEPVTYLYNVDADEVPCDQQSVFLWLDLVITSPDCPEGESCRNKASTIEVKLMPRAEFFPAEVCLTDEVFFANGSCHATSYIWEFGDGNTSTDENPNHQYDQPGVYTVTLTAINDCGQDTATGQILVVGEPVASFTPELDSDSGCTPLSVHFQNNSENVNLDNQTVQDWTWKINPTTGWQFDGNASNNQHGWETDVVFLEPGDYEVTLIVENICGTSTFSSTVTAIEAPTIALESPGTFCETATIDFNNYVSYTGSVFGYEWMITPPDGTTIVSTEPYPTFDFVNVGNYNISLEVDGGACGTYIESTTFSITQPLVADVINAPSLLCTNSEPITLQTNPIGGTWSSNPINAVENGLINPANLTPRTYTISFLPEGDCVEATSFELEILEAPAIQVESPTPACESLAYRPRVQTSGDFQQIRWQAIQEDGTLIDNGTVSQASELPSVNYNTVGAHLYILSLSGECETLIDTTIVTVLGRTAIQIPPLDAPICNESAPIQFEATPSGGTWQPNPLISPEGIFDPQQAGVGTFNLVYTFDNGACIDESSVEITVHEAAPVAIESDRTLCVDNVPYTLNFSPAGGVWSGMGITDAQAGIFDPSTAGVGIHELTYTLQNFNACEVVKTMTITVEDVARIDLDNAATFCVDIDNINLVEMLNLAVSLENGEGRWSGTGIIDSENGLFNSQISGTGTFTVQYDYTKNGCTATANASITIIEPSIVSAGDDQEVCINDGVIQLVGFPENGLWSSEFPIDSLTGEIDVAQLGQGSYRFIYTIAAGTSCEQSDIVEVLVTDMSIGLYAGEDRTICSKTIPFQLRDFTPIGNGKWSGTGVSETGLVNPALMQTDSIYTLQYCVDNPQINCQACDELEITVVPSPTADFETPITLCLNEPFTVVNQTEEACTYKWDFGDGAVSNAESPEHIYTATGQYTIEMTAVGCNGCVDRHRRTVFVTQSPVANFDTDVEAGCADLKVGFSNFSLGEFLEYDWDFGNGVSSSFDKPDTMIYKQGRYDTTYVVRLTVSNVCGTDTHQDSVTVLPKPIVNLGTNIDEGCSPLEIEFANITYGNPTSYAWYINDILISRDSLISNQILTANDSTITTYEAKLVARNLCGVDTMNREITVFPSKVVAFMQVDSIKGCEPLTVNFTNFSTPGATITYDFGDGNGSTEQNPVHTFENPGTFKVYQYASNCGSDVDSVVIKVLPAPDVGFAHPNYACAGQPIEFTNTSNGIISGFWNFGEGGTDTLASPTHTFNTPGLHEVSYTGYSSLNACPATFTSTIEVLGSPTINFSPSTNSGCVPLTVTFDNQSESATFFEWQFDALGNASNQENPVHVFEDPGVYPVTLIGTDDYGCFADTTIVNIIAHDVPTSNFTTDANRYCKGADNINVSNLSSENASQYEWYLNDELLSYLFEPNILPRDTGVQDLILITETAFGCKDTALQTITIHQQPLANISPIGYEGCASDSVLFFGSASGIADSWYWNFGDSTISFEQDPMHRYAEGGVYSVQLIVGNDYFCYDTAYISNAIRLLDSPTAQFSWKDKEEGMIEFENESINADNFVWDFGDGIQSIEVHPTHEYIVNGTHQILLTAFHRNGCTDTYSELIKPTTFTAFYAPNAFSPNNGVGDVQYFKPIGIGIEDYLIQIYSPWGQLLWESKLMHGEQPNDAWDGTYKGELMPQGAYVWKADITYVNGRKELVTGTVTLLR